jgi:hypothetical protein
MTTDMLNLQKPEPTLKNDQLTSLKTKFIDIEKEINESDLDIDLKKFMLKRIKNILNALDEYKISGIEPISDAINITIGQIVINNDIASKSKESSIAKKFWELIVDASVIVTLATGVPQIENNLQNLLPLIEKVNSNQNKQQSEDIIDIETIDEKDDSRYIKKGTQE